MPVVNKAVTETNSREGLRRLEQQISSFERMFDGISLVLNPGRATTS
jgi:hypothetical protein